MATRTAEYALAPHIVLLLVDDGTARILDMDGQFYALSTTGATMLQEFLKRGTDAAVRAVAARHILGVG